MYLLFRQIPIITRSFVTIFPTIYRHLEENVRYCHHGRLSSFDSYHHESQSASFSWSVSIIRCELVVSCSSHEAGDFYQWHKKQGSGGGHKVEAVDEGKILIAYADSK